MLFILLAIFYLSSAAGPVYPPLGKLLNTFPVTVRTRSVIPPPVISSAIQLVQPKQWLYLSGDNFVPDRTNVSFTFAQIKQVVRAAVYNSRDLGVTVPSSFLSDSGLIKVVTPSGTSNAVPLFVGNPTSPPFISDLKPVSGGYGCYLYVGGGNFFIGSSRILIGNVQVESPAWYDSGEVGITIPQIASFYGAAGAKITVVTPLGSAVSKQSFVTYNTTSSGFC
eukprot:TRINITY_DN1909_c0_g1_i3.p1 TRINITY_DN1909_c0_g1~~TRINITY_DN1909_c0_g1_i3.p1  ORF type:complete len:223 (-),score=14.90 TRINITY_DN1909_c0_g1_i3:207-875(-)